jgi:predicted metal-dependent peptidase
MKPTLPTELKLTRARVQLLLKHPFFASLCLRLKLVPGPFPTMATNGKVISYNPSFVDSLTPEELEGVLAHEVLHCALGHHCRRGKRKPRLWNIAADYAINPIILQNGLALPEGVLVKDEYNGLCAEEIYSRLEREAANGGGSQSQSPNAGGSSGAPNNNDATAQDTTEGEDDLTQPRQGGFGEVLDATDDEGNPACEGERTRQAHTWTIAAGQAMQAAKFQGHEAAGVERPIKESRQSQQNWRTTLRNFVSGVAFADYTWFPPNRRYVHSGLYLPSIYRDGVGRIVIGVDTSGSIGEKELQQFAGEISAISDQVQPELIHVVYCDAAVNSTQEFGPSEPIVLEPKGGGGTDFRPVFEWVSQNDINPACLIYLTDLYCDDYPATPPPYPVLWVTDSRRTAPFGETIKIIAE